MSSQKPPSADMLRKLKLWAYDNSVGLWQFCGLMTILWAYDNSVGLWQFCGLMTILWVYDNSVFTQLDCPTIQETTLSAVIFGVAFRSVVLPTGEKWMQKTVSYFLMLLLLSLGSLVVWVWPTVCEASRQNWSVRMISIASFSRIYKTNYTLVTFYYITMGI